jgi:hypothetical protein
MNPYNASESSLRSNTSGSSKALRAGRQYFWVGIIGVVLFSTAAIFGVAVSLRNIDHSFPHPIAFAICIGVEFAFFTALSAYLLRFYFKYRLLVDDLSVMQVGVFTTKRISIADIQSMTWRNYPKASGSVIIKSDSQKLRIEFGAVGRSALNELVAKIRQLAPEHKQLGWDKFKHKRIGDAKAAA